MFHKKQKAAMIVAALIVSLSTGGVYLPAMQTAYASWQAAGVAAEGQITKDDMVVRAVHLYEQLSGKNTGDDVYKSAEKLGIIAHEELAELGNGTAISKQDAARLLYNAVIAYDGSFALSDSEIVSVLNDCYDNTYIDSQNRAAIAFLMKYGAVGTKTRVNPYIALPQEVAEQITADIFDEFTAKDSVTVGTHTLVIGEGVQGVLAEFGVPNRIDATEYGFDWYVYNADYENFLMVGIQNGKVCAFFSNAKKLNYHDIRTLDDVPANCAARLLWLPDGTLDGVYYNTLDKVSEPDEQMCAGAQSRLLDMINSYRAKQSLPLLIERSDLLTDEHTVSVTAEASDIFELYQNSILTSSGSQLFHGFVKHNCYTKLQLAYTGAGILMSADIDPNTTIKGARPITTADMAEHIANAPAVTEAVAPTLITPVNEQVYEYGEDVVLTLPEAAANRYLVQMLNTETDEYAVNAYITTSQTELTFPAGLFDDGADYVITISAADGDELLTSEPIAIVYGYSRPPIIVSPAPNAILSSNSVTVSWQSDMYSDFYLELYRNGEPVCNTRVSGEYSTQLMDLELGSYMLGVSALRKNTNVIKNTSWIRFDLSALPIVYETQYITREDGTMQEVQVPIANPASKTHFTSDKYMRIFGGSQVYTTKEQADANMRVITIPVWRMKADGTKYSSSTTLTVHQNIADDLVSIFTEIYNGSEQFPIKSVGGYNWRTTATGTTSQHSYGTCIDINPDENYCIYFRTGRQIGSFWKPYDNAYSIRPDGDVVRAFTKYGWAWGGNWNSMKDYMHFSYLGG